MNDLTRSTEAETAVAASYAARQRKAQPNGWWGAALLVATETALFGSLVATYFFLANQAPSWPPPGVEAPKPALPLALTGVLVLTTIPMFLAARAGRRGSVRAARLWVLPALAVQCGYLATQVVLFSHDLSKFSPRDSAYGSIYFTLLAVHHAHVVVGILLSAWLVSRLAFGLTNYRLIALRVVALYWYFVAAVGVLVVLTQLSPAL
ncbi:MAG TPA: cytochrome c oxidase subunit 3 [Thermoleophilaceae bacterium]|nr:cytochrome c oxidase subunit 3 [Thermoleophilaceae bacterium]